MTQQEYLSQIEAWLARTGVPESVLSRLAAGDPSHVYKLRKGRVPGLDVADRVLKFMETYKPEAENGNR